MGYNPLLSTSGPVVATLDRWIWNGLAIPPDYRTKDWFLMESPGYISILVLFMYLPFCTRVGPWLMRDRKPFDLRNTIIFYNFTQVIFSAFIFYEGLQGGWANGYDWTCQPMDPSTSPTAMRMARAVWLYFICKLVDLLDTVFFVLRKKNNQVSFLHLYHHVSMVGISWGGTRYMPGGHGTMLGLLNSFVHVVMYTYYMLSAFGPHMQKYLWWKRYLTRMQMIQFLMVLVHTLLILQPSCTYPKVAFIFLAPNTLIFFYLFNDFYRQAYRKPAQTNGKVSNGVHTNGTNGVHKNGTNGVHQNGNSYMISACYSPNSKLD
ncbi:very long chain fatty acid elongase 7-like [Cloeon dipterum]|uniref:very long chain fatty acid elongase 7-like n=1 Tax=Cloeon dipterum TaxID=197152 RepID=UPI0032209F77